MNSSEDIKIVKTDVGSIDGQNKCPKCGATDISYNINTGKLRCNYCRYEFDLKKVIGFEEDISKLEGKVISSGTQNINSEFNNIVTLKCSSCGAEVVIDTSQTSNARCHWCRNVLSINNQLPNGTIPDVLLPFAITKEEAKNQIQNFVKKRSFYANTKFKKEFTLDNVMGVYFPYMIVDINSHASFSGQGEVLIRRYTKKEGKHTRTYYDASVYNVSRDFDLTINGLTIESNSERLNNKSTEKTNNIINSIMPFDIENCVKFDSNYLRGYTSEKRNIDIEQLKNLVKLQSEDIARFACNDTLKKYDRGVCWSNQTLTVKGQQWKTAYLPVWLYSYYQEDNKVLHYVAVNARTKETMGSIPINITKLLLVSFLIELCGGIVVINVDSDIEWIFLLPGIIYFFIIYNKYRNSKARHMHETETKTNMTNLKSKDIFVQKKYELSNSRIYGMNNNIVKGSTNRESVFDNLLDDKTIKEKSKF